jgi:hypothetical protein
MMLLAFSATFSNFFRLIGGVGENVESLGINQYTFDFLDKNIKKNESLQLFVTPKFVSSETEYFLTLGIQPCTPTKVIP